MKKHLKWMIPAVFFAGIGIYLFTSSGMGKVATDLTQAYADPNLYKDAIQMANSNDRIEETIGEIEAIEKMAILNGEVIFSENNENVNSTIKIIGSKGSGKMDIQATREKEGWNYEKIKIRYKDPEGNKQQIEVID